jgi:hypothetical protein
MKRNPRITTQVRHEDWNQEIRVFPTSARRPR